MTSLMRRRPRVVTRGAVFCVVHEPGVVDGTPAAFCRKGSVGCTWYDLE